MLQRIGKPFMFDLIAKGLNTFVNFLEDPNSLINSELFTLERYIRNELDFKDELFIKLFLLAGRFEPNIAERKWFINQDKEKQVYYLLLLKWLVNKWVCSPACNGSIDVRSLNTRENGLDLWGDELIKLHESNTEVIARQKRGVFIPTGQMSASDLASFLSDD